MPYPILKVIRAYRHIVVSWHIGTSVHMHKRLAITDAIIQSGQCSGRCVSRFQQRFSRVRGAAETNEDTCLESEKRVKLNIERRYRAIYAPTQQNLAPDVLGNGI